MILDIEINQPSPPLRRRLSQRESNVTNKLLFNGIVLNQSPYLAELGSGLHLDRQIRNGESFTLGLSCSNIHSS